jgi:hypothetical protein
VAAIAVSGFAVYRFAGSGGTDGPPTGSGITSSASSASSTSSAPSPSQSPADHPTPATTGVPPGTSLKKLAPNDADGNYRVTKNGTTLDRVHITGNLLITANDATITNSQIDGTVIDEYDDQTYSFTISDSTVGPARGCIEAPGLGVANYTATRVNVRGHDDGFRASGPNIEIHDSYVRLCQQPDSHSDGLQTYMTGRHLVLDHTTIDQRGLTEITAPIFVTDPGAEDVTITDNLLMGGTFSIQVRARGKVVVKNNMLVADSWMFGPVDSGCGDNVDWSGNKLVKIDKGYHITEVVDTLACSGS